MIDWNRVAELRDEIGAEDFAEVVDIFLEEVDAAIEVLGDGSEPLEAQMHFLKGSALNLGFAAFSELCAQGEKQATLNVSDVALAPILACYKHSRKAFLADMESTTAA